MVFFLLWKSERKAKMTTVEYRRKASLIIIVEASNKALIGLTMTGHDGETVETRHYVSLSPWKISK
jgi:hypothetical protein